MFDKFLKSIFGSRNDRLLKSYRAVVVKINALEPSLAALSDDELRAKTAEYKQRFAAGETLDALLPEAFATVREASKRVLEMRHFDVQLVGGMALHDGKIAEMRTGEGKTLMSTLPIYLNALSGKGVHLVTVNDYLARRDADWMGRIYRFLGMSVGTILSQQDNASKIAAYAADITYGTNNEYGFDYLRDNMEYAVADRRQRGLNFAIIDEVDSILIDEARTPLIISGQAEDNVDIYYKINALPPTLKRQADETATGDYHVDEKGRQVHLSELGHENAEKWLEATGLLAPGTSLYDATNISLMHHVFAALRAHTLYNRDEHYVVQDGEVVIVDEFTGRMMTGRRWSEGLHQAVEAKEGVPIQRENQTLASITFQNFFRMYGKLGGMTGTADTEAYEFQQTYGLETVIIPTHRDMVRRDENDLFFKSTAEKYAAAVHDIRACYDRGQPVLVGTTSIENSELISALLNKEKLPHQVLNAKQHEREAHIVSQAGQPKAITIATNMAGRGTDIVLGGALEPELRAIREDEALSADARQAKIATTQAEWKIRHDQVLASGGLRIVGTERHESRRIDNQLRGRAGRQGDAGSSRFFLSAEDPLIRIFGGDRMKNIMTRLRIPDGEPIEAGIMTRQIEKAQLKVEARNFDIRKQLLEYDDVANDQRKAIYEQRNHLLEHSNVSDTVRDMIGGWIETTVNAHVPPESIEEQWDIAGLEAALADAQVQAPVSQWLKDQPDMDDTDIRERCQAVALDAYAKKREIAGDEVFSQFERNILLQIMDTQWREHLSNLDLLRQGIHLRGYAQKNPKQEYKRESFEMFGGMLDRFRTEVVRILLTVQVRSEADAQAVEPAPAMQNVAYQHAGMDGLTGEAEAPAALPNADPSAEPFVRQGPKLGRNDPCWCGSGKKYKHCHGALE
ncbi:MAG: preprotein translocase subunit SecA [Betaproteobacteria bacterium]|nr:MAG: preprotein translocase subunit SecA [Betaproteobacteria bacterium]TAG47599.1 MAG: preprotein translocase subunit SecA [Betaproteobacteria bacterium]